MDEIRRALTIHGKARATAKAKAAKESEAIRALVPQAVAAGIPKSEIARLAQISRPALDTMLRER
jgi:hypothetical protein